jgi:membrane protein
MENMICEEIKEQWKGKIVGILIIIVFLFSISEGVLEVYNLKNLYNNIQKVVEDKKETDYGLIQYEQDEYNRKKESIYLQNLPNAYFIKEIAVLTTIIAIYTAIITFRDIKNNKIKEKIEKNGFLKTNLSKIISILPTMLLAIVIGLVSYMVAVEGTKLIIGINNMNLSNIGLLDKSILNFNYSINYIYQAFIVICFNILSIYIVYGMIIYMPYEILIYIFIISDMLFIRGYTNIIMYFKNIFVISENTKNTNNITGVAVVYIVLTIVATLAIMENKKYFYKKIGLDKG